MRNGNLGLEGIGGGDRSAPDGIMALVVSDAVSANVLSDAPFIDAGVEVLHVSGVDAAAAAFAEHIPELVFLPVVLGGRPVRPLLDQMLAADAPPIVVVVATNNQINAAADAMHAGAFDCLFRPFTERRQAKTLEAALRALLAARPADETASPVGAAERPGSAPAPVDPGPTLPADDPLVFHSAAMRAAVDHLDAVAPSDAPVFLIGEYGSGKTLAARRLHDMSCRAAKGAFVTVDCAALTPGRFEVELAGPDGALARAAGGTLYLDEICALDPQLQPRLLRMIDAGGTGNGPTASGARLVTGTERDAQAMVRDGRLSSALYYRLHVAPVTLPPLRTRPSDIRVIAEAKLAEFARAEGRDFAAFSEQAMTRLEAYPWPGNLRELHNAVWSAVVLHDGPLVTPEMLPEELVARQRPVAAPAPGIDGFLGRTLDEIERAVIEATIDAEGGSVPRAARVLDVSPSTLYRKREAWAKRRGG